MKQQEKHQEIYKQEAVSAVDESKNLLKEIAQELKINTGMLSCWLSQQSLPYKNLYVTFNRDEDEQIGALKYQIAEAKKERDFLKAAVDFLVANPIS